MDLSKSTYPEASAVLGPDTLALIPIGCTEPHGPHLPLDTDVTIAVAQSRRAAELLSDERVQAVVLPPIAYGITNFTEGFAGRLSIQPATLWALLEDLVGALEQSGVRRIVFSNGHLEPAHVAVLRGVALDHAARSELKAQVLVFDVTRRRFAERLGAAFCKGDHAGRYETSLLLAADRAAVREDVQLSLAEVDVDLVGAIQRGAQHFRAIGAHQAYCGDPARASAEEGHATILTLAQLLVEQAREAWPELFA